MAIGSGGTAAGLLAGLPLAGLRTEVVGIAVYGKRTPSARRIRRLARRTLSLLDRKRAELAPLELRSDWLGGGYGHRTPEAEAATRLAREREDLKLDPVYTPRPWPRCSTCAGTGPSAQAPSCTGTPTGRGGTADSGRSPREGVGLHPVAHRRTPTM